MFPIRTKKKKASKKGLLCIIIIVIILIIILLIFSASNVEISITTRKEKFGIDFNTDISAEPGENQISGQILSTIVKGSAKIRDIEVTKGEARAEGTVILINRFDQDQTLIENTRLLSDSGILFRTKERIVIKKQSETKVEVKADETGKKSEISPTHFILPGLPPEMQDKVFAESKEKMVGKANDTRIITQEIIDKGTEKAIEEIANKGIEELEGKLPKDEQLKKEAITKDIISTKPDKEAGNEGKEFQVYVELRLTAVTYNKEEMFKLASEKLKNQIPKDMEYIETDDDSLKLTLETYNADSKEATFFVHVEAKTVSKITESMIDKSKLVGRNKEETKDYFKKFNSVGSVDVHFFPSWVKNVPSNPEKIKIIVANNE